MSTPIFPFVHAQGSWGDMGQQVGVMLAPLIARHIEAWLGHVARETGASRAAALATEATFRAPIRYATYALATCRTGALSVTVRDPYPAAAS